MSDANSTPTFQRRKPITPYIGQVFGRLTVIREAVGDERLPKYLDRVQAFCLCKCGNAVVRILSHVLNGQTVACGCKPPIDFDAAKRCSTCKELKPRTEFFPQQANRDGLRSNCKQCHRISHSASYQKHKAKRTAQRATMRDHTRQRQREWDWKRQYGITKADYDLILAAQGGGCGICGTTSPGSKNWLVFCVDHDHKTNVVRGLLCLRCNSKLAILGDDLATVFTNLLPFIAYLKRAEGLLTLLKEQDAA